MMILAFMVIFAILGVAYLVYTKAATPPAVSGYSQMEEYLAKDCSTVYNKLCGNTAKIFKSSIHAGSLRADNGWVNIKKLPAGKYLMCFRMAVSEKSDPLKVTFKIKNGSTKSHTIKKGSYREYCTSETSVTENGSLSAEYDNTVSTYFDDSRLYANYATLRQSGGPSGNTAKCETLTIQKGSTRSELRKRHSGQTTSKGM